MNVKCIKYEIGMKIVQTTKKKTKESLNKFGEDEYDKNI